MAEGRGGLREVRRVFVLVEEREVEDTPQNPYTGGLESAESVQSFEEIEDEESKEQEGRDEQPDVEEVRVRF